jgi:hypothetical protein
MRLTKRRHSMHDDIPKLTIPLLAFGGMGVVSIKNSLYQIIVKKSI